MSASPLAISEQKMTTKDTETDQIALSVRSERLPEALDIQCCEISTSDYLVGLRLYSITIALCLGLLLSTLEISIVSTSLVSITDSLSGFSKSSWIVTVYLVNYTGFMIIFAKLSDIFGRKVVTLSALAIFIIASGACGAAQTITQLIVFRAFQGIGGSGIYAMSMVIISELVPMDKYPKYSSIATSTIALSFLMGPLLGGAINIHGSWRWVFLLNVPCGAVAIISLFLALPASFPYITNDKSIEKIQAQPDRSFKKVDFVGGFLLLTASISLLAALQEVGLEHPWQSSLIIALLVTAGIIGIAFLCWEWFVSQSQSILEPVFTWEFVRNRVFMGMLVNAFLVGFPFTVAVIEIPQRLQAVNGKSPLDAGIGLLPLAVCTPFAAGLSAYLSTKVRVPPIYLLLIGTIIQTTGVALLSTLPSSGQEVSRPAYGYEALMGLGSGMNMGTLILLAPLVVEKKDLAVAIGAINQARVLGGAIGLGVATCVFNVFIKTRLTHILSVSQLSATLESTKSIELLPTDLREATASVFAGGYNLQMRIMIGVSAAEILATALMWEKKPRMSP